MIPEEEEEVEEESYCLCGYVEEHRQLMRIMTSPVLQIVHYVYIVGNRRMSMQRWWNETSKG